MKNKKIKIQILLSTYNGERYLKEQLDSYLIQNGNFDIRVLIRDDGSTDATADILGEYQRKYGFEVLRGDNIGVNQSMKVLFDHSDRDADYFAISDQDDVWCEDKLESAVHKLASKNPEIPLLYASSSLITDENLCPIGMTLYPSKKASYYNAMVQNICQGHTEVFNQHLMNELRKYYPVEIYAVDWWIYLIAAAIGEMDFDEKYTVYHRQHGVNSVGYETNIRKKIFRRIGYLKENKASQISRQLRAFYEQYRGQMPEEYRVETEHYLDFEKDKLQRLYWLFKTRIYRQKAWEGIMFKVLYWLGFYDIE